LFIHASNPIPESGHLLYVAGSRNNQRLYTGTMASPSDQAQEYAADVVATLAALGVTSHIETQEARSGDALLVLPGSKLEVEVKTLLRPEAVGAILGSHRRRRPLLIISDRIPEVARERLREAGINFYDRSGHLRIVAPPVVIDTGVPSLVNTTATSHPLDTPTGRDVAIACLADARRAHGVRETARWVDRDPGSVSRVMSALRSEGLLSEDGRPAIPGLFRSLASHWRRNAIALAKAPEPGMARLTDQLRLGLDDHAEVGWALTDTVAAQAWGAPIVARGDYPPDFYVPDGPTLRRAELLLGRAERPELRGCTVAVTPAPVVCHRRVERGVDFPVASHVVVALDLALDPSRGAEALRAWRPKDVTRVW
jgi:hypothetical protein